MEITVFGAGYVGLVTGAGFASSGNQVTIVDTLKDRIQGLNDGKCPIHEPLLDELLINTAKAGNLKFLWTGESDFLKLIEDSEAFFIAVGTPEDERGRTRMEFVDSAAEMISQLPGDLRNEFVVTKSTVPIGTGDRLEKIFKAKGKSPAVVSNPEFLKQGNAVRDFLEPERVIIGTDNPLARDKLSALYKPWVNRTDRIHLMNRRSAELVKYACNAFLATKISFINEISQLAEVVDADIREVREGMITDSRIGNQFLYPGIGYGGSCFQKDVHSLINQAKDFGINLEISKSSDAVNQKQKLWPYEKLNHYFKKDLKGKTICLWGLSFKPLTDDLREAPALLVVKQLVDAGAKIQAFDPAAGKRAQYEFKYAIDSGAMKLFKDPYEAARGSDAVLLMTEWHIFRSPNFKKLAKIVNNPLMLDGRNIYDEKVLKHHGFTYACVGVASTPDLRLMLSQNTA